MMTAFIFEGLANILRFVPGNIRHKLLQGMGWIYGSLPHGQLKALKFNLRLLMHLKEPELDKTAKEIFQNFATTLFDFSSPKNIHVEFPRKKELENWRSQHGSLMLLTFHMGLWELGARILGNWGWPVTAIYQPYKNKHLKRVIEKWRAPGVDFIPVGNGAAKSVSQAFREGKLVAMLGDHHFGEEGIPVELLGHNIKWAKGPVLFAVKEQFPIIVSVVIRTGPRSYRVIIEDPLIPRDRSLNEIQRLAQEVADKFGNFLTAFPTQWYYFQPLEVLPRQEGEPEELGKVLETVLK